MICFTAQKDNMDDLSIASEDIVKAIDKKFISFTPNTLLCDISNIIPNHQSLVRVEGRHILNKEVHVLCIVYSVQCKVYSV